MTRIQNTSPLGDLDVPLLRRVVKAGEIVDVPAAHATLLLAQTGTWASPGRTTPAAADAAAVVTTEQGGTPA